MVVCCLAAAPARAAVEETHRFGDTRGGTFSASVLSVKGGVVELRRANGQTMTRPLDTFPPSERDYIVAWLEENTPPGTAMATPASKITAAVSVYRDSGQVRGRNPDQRQAKVQLRLRVESDELTESFRGLSGTLIAIGQSVTGEGIFKIYSRETFFFDLTKGERFDFEGKPFPEFVDDQTYAKFGYKFRGYVLVLQNTLGDVIYFRASPSFLRSAEEALLLRPGRAYDRQFVPLQPLQRPY